MRSPLAAGGKAGAALASIAGVHPYGSPSFRRRCSVSAVAASDTSGSPKPQSIPQVPGTQWQKLSLHTPRPEQPCLRCEVVDEVSDEVSDGDGKASGGAGHSCGGAVAGSGSEATVRRPQPDRSHAKVFLHRRARISKTDLTVVAIPAWEAEAKLANAP